VPGNYVVRLTVGGKTYMQPLRVKMDPRVKTPATAIAQTHTMAVALYDAIARDSVFLAEAQLLREKVRGSALEAKLNGIAGAGAGGGRRGGGGGRGAAAPSGPTLASMSGELLSLMNLLEDADVEPTTQALAAVRTAQKDFASLETRWKAFVTEAKAAGFALP